MCRVWLYPHRPLVYIRKLNTLLEARNTVLIPFLLILPKRTFTRARTSSPARAGTVGTGGGFFLRSLPPSARPTPGVFVLLLLPPMSLPRPPPLALMAAASFTNSPPAAVPALLPTVPAVDRGRSEGSGDGNDAPLLPATPVADLEGVRSLSVRVAAVLDGDEPRGGEGGGEEEEEEEEEGALR